MIDMTDSEAMFLRTLEQGEVLAMARGWATWGAVMAPPLVERIAFSLGLFRAATNSGTPLVALEQGRSAGVLVVEAASALAEDPVFRAWIGGASDAVRFSAFMTMIGAFGGQFMLGIQGGYPWRSIMEGGREMTRIALDAHGIPAMVAPPPAGDA